VDKLTTGNMPMPLCLAVSITMTDGSSIPAFPTPIEIEACPLTNPRSPTDGSGSSVGQVGNKEGHTPSPAQNSLVTNRMPTSNEKEACMAYRSAKTKCLGALSNPYRGPGEPSRFPSGKVPRLSAQL